MKVTNKISKSEVMSKAWSIYKNCRRMFPTFSSALVRAWEVIKANLATQIRNAETANQVQWYNENKQAIRSAINNTTQVSSYYGVGAYNGD